MTPKPPTTTPQPAWTPDASTVERANVTRVMTELGFTDYEDFHRWTISHRAEFWDDAVRRLGIVLDEPYGEIVDLSEGVEQPRWLVGGRLNIAKSCFQPVLEETAPDKTAVLYRHRGSIRELTFRGLQQAAADVAEGLRRAGISRGDAVAIAMPMTVESVQAYLGVVAAGAVVVSIADSFAPAEIATRLRITNADTVITQDVIERAGKTLPMYEKVVAAGATRCIVVDTGSGVELRPDDLSWDAFLADDAEWDPVRCGPGETTNVLFSSGTTAEPKAIPWSHTTPIKCAVDGFYHHDIHPDDVVAWPTNLGWMMGPWLIYASLINRAALALYDDVPTGRGFVEFVRDAGVTVLGVVPSLVSAWRDNGALDGVDLSSIRLFSSTGEASNESDMSWLMGQAGGRPVIEYCGGTEIGGGYITGTVVQPQVAAAFSTPAVGWNFRIVDDAGQAASAGELFLVPPSMGMSVELLNRDHHEVYYADVPGTEEPLRRHGDHMEWIGEGYVRAHGRADDTMNLGGIKVGSAEIERTLLEIPGVVETAAIAVEPPSGGPSRLVIYAVPAEDHVPDLEEWRAQMQQAIGENLNPLFKIHEVVATEALPRTASAKVMRRELRAAYQSRQ